MATTTLTDVRLLTGGYEVTTDHNQLQLTRVKDAVDATTFGSSSRVYREGLKSASYSFAGFFDADGTDEIDDVYASELAGTSSNVVTIVAPDGSTGAASYSFESLHSTYSPWGGSIGDMAAFQIDGVGTGDSFRGQVLEDGTTARSSSSNSTAVQLTGVSSGETARAALHVIAKTGSPTLDVVVASDDSGAFSSGTDRITFTQATDVGAQYETSTTVTADDYWRTEWTFGGTGSITFLVTFGIA